MFVAETDLLPPDAGCRVLEQVAAWHSFRRHIGLMKPLCHILIMIGHTITVVWIVPPCQNPSVRCSPAADTVEIVDVDIDVVAVVLPAITVTMTAIVVMIIIIVMMMMVMIVVVPVDAAE